MSIRGRRLRGSRLRVLTRNLRRDITVELASMRNIAFVFALFYTSSTLAESLPEYLKAHGRAPAEYVLAKIDEYPIVVLGENHWQRRDEELVVSLLPELQRRHVAYASELLGGENQADIDALVSAPEWNASLANKIMHDASWPYVQYRDILYAAWKSNHDRATGSAPLAVIALGPPQDFREKKIDYESYMAERVMKYAPSADRHIVMHCGMHHAFTRYQQIELGRMRNGHATEFMDRAGNMLWRRYAQDVFLIALHKADACGGTAQPFSKLCAPLGGIIDCAAEANGGHPVAFDILGSPLAEAKFPADSFYAIAHPLLRMIDYADGYVWQQPVDRITLVDLIPLDEYAPELTHGEKNVEQWRKRADDLKNPDKRPSWAHLSEWRSTCAVNK